MTVIESFARDIQAMLQQAGSIWTYEGPPNKSIPHALLTSGEHSDRYVNVGQHLKTHSGDRLLIAYFLTAALDKTWKGKFTRVVGSDTSATDLAKDVATIAKVDRIRMVKTVDRHGNKSQVWHPDNSPLFEDDIILHVEELVTTALSATQVRAGIQLANLKTRLNFVPFLPVAVDRSNPDAKVVQLGTSTILPLLQFNIRTYKPNKTDCPYCAVGSEALLPNQGDNWSKFFSK